LRFITRPFTVTSSAATERHEVAALVQSISICRMVFRPMLVGLVLGEDPGCV